MTVTEISIPATPGPFVNTPLLRIGEGTFWISSYNPVNGAVGVVVDRAGHRVIELGHDCPGAYSAVVDEEGILWLCGDLATILRVDPVSGDVSSFGTGHSPALVFQGMHRDAATGRLFVAAFDGTRTDCLVFDPAAGCAVVTLAVPGAWRYLRASFIVDSVPYLIVETPGVGMVRIASPGVDPSLHALDLPLELAVAALAFADTDLAAGIVRGEVTADHPWVRAANSLEGLRCLGVRDGKAVCAFTAADRAVVVKLDQNGESEIIADVADAMPFNLALDGDEVVAVDAFGVLSRWALATGTSIAFRDLGVRGVGAVDVLVSVDERTLLGSTFISQRFWTIDLVTGEGRDRGRAAPGFGEVLQTIPHADRVLMAAYSGGEVMSWDPRSPGDYPDNPRVLFADSEAMRPVALLACGDVVFYAASRHYGLLGSRVIELEPSVGSASALGLAELRITGAVRAPSGTIVAATTIHADARSAAPTAERCSIILYDVSPLRETARLELDARWDHAFVHGMLSATRALCSGWNPHDDVEEWFSVDVGEERPVVTSAVVRLPETTDRRAFAGRPDLLAGRCRIRAAGAPGLFVIHVEDRFELWDMNTLTMEASIVTAPAAYGFEVEEQTLTIVEPLRVRRFPMPSVGVPR